MGISQQEALDPSAPTTSSASAWRDGSAPQKTDPRIATYRHPQHQLHEFLHRVLLVLRVLPPAWIEGGYLLSFGTIYEKSRK
jgi:hypothetical protein